MRTSGIISIIFCCVGSTPVCGVIHCCQNWLDAHQTGMT